MPNIDFTKMNNTQSEELGSKPVDPTTGLSFDNLPDVNVAYSPSGHRTNINIKPRLIGPVTPALGENYYQRLAAGEQSVPEQFGAFLNQAISGEIVGGAIEGLGYLTDLQQYYEIATGQEKEFGNWLSDVGKSLRTWSEESTPIYTDPDQKKFAMGHFSWWMQNGKSVASTLSLLLPAVGAIRAAGAAGKALGLTKAMSKAGEALGVTNEMMSALGKSAKGISTAVVSRHMENMMEASQTMEDVIQDQLALGKTREEAEEIASHAAANSYSKNWLMLMQDIPEYMVLGKFMNKASGKAIAGVEKELNRSTKLLRAKGATAVGFNMVSEGYEEGYQFVIGEESKHLARTLDDPDYDPSFKDRFNSYLRNGELYTNAFMGFLGAGVTIAAAPLIGKLRGEETEEDRRRKNLYDFGAMFAQKNEHLSRARELEDKDAIYSATTRLLAKMAHKASVTGGLKDTVDFISSIKDSANGYNKEDLEKFGMTEEDAQFVRDNFGSHIEDLKKFESILNKYKKNVNIHAAAKLAEQEFVLEKLKDHTAEVENNVIKAKDAVPGLKNLSFKGQSVVEQFGELESMKKVTSLLQKRVNNEKLSNTERERDKSDLQYYNDAIKELASIYEKTKEAYNAKDSEDKAEDLRKNINLEDILKGAEALVKAESSKAFHKLSVDRQTEVVQDEVRAYNQGAYKTKDTKAYVDNLHKAYRTKYDTALNTITPVLSDEIKGKLKEYIKNGAHPMALLIDQYSPDKELTAAIKKALSGNKPLTDNLNSLNSDYLSDLFFAVTGESKSLFAAEDIQGVKEMILKNLGEHLNKDFKSDLYNDSNEVEDTSEEPVTPVKPSIPQVDQAIQDLVNSAEPEDISENEFYADPKLLELKLNILLPVEMSRARIKFKGEPGMLERNKGAFQFTPDSTGKVTHGFTTVDGGYSLKKLGITPIQSVYDITSNGSVTLNVSGKVFNLNPNNPLSVIEVVDGNPVSVTLSSVANKKYTYDNPILVKEIALFLEMQTAARLKVFDEFKETGINHPIFVTDPETGKEFLVYDDQGAWVVLDPKDNSVVKFKTVNARVLDKLFSVLDSLIGLTKEQKDEYRSNVEGVRRPTPKEISTIPTHSTVPSAEGSKDEKGRPDDQSREEGNRSQTEQINEKGKDLAANKATNLQNKPISTEGSVVTQQSSNIPPEAPGSPVDYNEPELIQGRFINLRNKITSAPDLNLYLEDNKNDVKGDRIEFYIDRDPINLGTDVERDDFKGFWSKHPDLVIDENILKPNDPEEKFDSILDTIPIRTRYITKDGKVMDGYYLPQSNDTRNAEQFSEFTPEETAEFLEQEKRNIRKIRRDVIREIIAGNTPFSEMLYKSMGEINKERGAVYNVEDFLGIPASEVIMGYSRDDLYIKYSDETFSRDKVPSPGQIFVLTNRTCNSKRRPVKLQRKNISEEHANIILDCYIAAVQAGSYKTTPYNNPRVYVIENGKRLKLPVGNVINTLIHNGATTRVTGNKINERPYLLSKQLFDGAVVNTDYEGIIYYGDFNKGGEFGGSLDLRKPISKKEREDFIKYVTKNMTYSGNASMFNKKYNVEKHIGDYTIKADDTSITALIHNNLVVVEDINKTRPYQRPWIGIESNSIRSAKGPKKSEEVIQKNQEVLQEVVEKVNTITAEAPTVVGEVKGLSSLTKDSVIKHIDNNKEKLFGTVMEDEKGLYISVNADLASPTGRYSDKVYLNDTDSLSAVIEENVLGSPGNYYSYFTVTKLPNNIPEAGSEGKKPSVKELREKLAREKKSGLYTREVDSTVKPEEYNIKDEIDNVRSMLGNVNIKLTDRLIRIAENGRMAWGTFTTDAITIYKGAAKGTVYHEAFHRVSLMYLSERERNMVYREAVNRYKLDKNARQRDIEEVLAEKFREYVLSAKKAEDEPRNIGSFFRDLVQFIITFLTGRNTIPNLNIDRLFKAIENKKFKYARARKNNLIRYSGREYLSEFFTPTQQDSIVNTMMFQLFRKNNITFAEDIKKMKVAPVLEFFQNKKQFWTESKMLVNQLGSREEALAAGMSEKELDEIDTRLESYTNIVENFRHFRELLEGRLMAMGISKPDNYDNGVYPESDEEDEYGSDTEIEKYDRSTFEFNQAEKTLANIKMFVTTIPITSEEEPKTGLPVYADFNTIWAKIMYELWRYDNLPDMIEYMEKRVEEGDPFYKILLNGEVNEETGEVYRIGLKNGPERLQTQFHRSFNMYRYNFTNLMIKGGINRTYKIIDSISAKESTAVMTRWSRGFKYSKLFDKGSSVAKRGVAMAVAQKFEDYKSRLNKSFNRNTNTYADLPSAVANLTLLLNYIGVQISQVDFLAYLHSLVNSKENIKSVDEALDFVLKAEGYLKDIFEYNPGSRQKSLLTLIATGEKLKNRNGKEIAYSDGLKTKTIIKEMSLIYAKSSNQMANIVLGPNNNMYYTYAQNSFSTDFIKQLNSTTYKKKFLRKNPLIAELEADIYNGHSLALKQIKEGELIELLTYSSFDDSRYQDLSPSQDFLFKFHSLMDKENPLIPFPTMADKPTYHMFKGLKKINMEDGKFDNYNNYLFPDRVYDMIEGYMEDESNRRRKAIADIEAVLALPEEERDYSTLHANYHYQKLDKEGRPILKVGKEYTGNATKFIDFPIMNKARINRNDISKHLKSRVNETLLYAERLGIITVERRSDGKGYNNIQNVLLDNDLVLTYTARYGTEKNAIIHLMSDFTVNFIMGMIENQKLMSKDPAFYKGATDKAKRLSELIAPGELLRTDYESGEFEGKTTYSAITIRKQPFNSPLSSPEGILYGKFAEQYRKNNLEPKDNADALKVYNDRLHSTVTAMLNSYSNVDSTDGQVWITAEFHRELKSRLGEWSDEMEKAYDLLMSKDSERTPQQEMNLRKIIMQPLKFVHYGVTLENGVGVPVYDKMSFATLFPQDVKGTRLEPLYDWMVKNKISMAKFDSAVKVGDVMPVSYFNEDGSVNTDSLKTAVVKFQQLRNLRMQQVTTPHEMNVGLLATQVKKVLPHKIEEMSKALSALSNLGKIKIDQLLGIDATGHIDNNKLYSDVFYNEALKAKLPNDILQYIKTDDEGRPYLNIDSFYDNKWFESRLISVIAKNTTTTKIPGNAFFQATSFGFEKVSKDDSLKLIDEDGYAEVKVSIGLFREVIPNYNHISFEEAREWVLKNKLRLEGIMYRIPTQGANMVNAFTVKDVLPEYTGNTILVPPEFVALTDSDFDIDKLYLFIHNYNVDEDGDPYRVKFIDGDHGDMITSRDTLEKIYNQEYGPKNSLIQGLKKILTETKTREQFGEMIEDLSETQKRDLMEIVDELPVSKFEDETEEDLTPSKVQKALDRLEKDHNFMTLERFINMNIDQSAWKVNSKKAIENRLLDIYIEHLTDEEYFGETKAPLSYFVQEAKRIAKAVYEKEGRDKEKFFLEDVSPLHQLETKQVYITSKSGVAPFALNIVHHTMGIQAGLGLNMDIGIGNRLKNGGIDLSQYKGQDGVSIFSWLSAMVSANVDAPKDPYIFYLNVNKTTWGMTNLLLRAGLGETTFYFLAQPILKQYVEMGGDFIAGTLLRQSYTEAINNLLGANASIDAKDIVKRFSGNASIFNIENLLKNIDVDRARGVEWYARQLAILNKYIGMSKAANKLNQIVMYSRVDTRGFGNNMVQARLFEEGLEDLMVDTDIVNFNELFDKTFLGTYRENTVKVMSDMFKNLTIGSTDAFIALLKQITKDTRVNGLSAGKKVAMINKIAKELMVAIKSRYFNTPKGFNMTPETVKDIFIGDEKSVGALISDIQNKNAPEAFNGLENNVFINYLIPYKDEKANAWFLESPIVDNKDPYMRDRLINGFTELLDHKEVEIRKLAKRLFAYSFFSTGFNRTIYSFNHTLPHKILKNNPTDLGNDGVGVSFDKFIKQALAMFQDNKMAEQFLNKLGKELYLNNWESDYIVPKIDRVNIAENNSIVIKEHDEKGNITKAVPIVFTGIGRDVNLLGVSKKGYLVYSPYVKFIDDKDNLSLYEFVGYIAGTGRPVYRYVNKKGLVSSSRSHRIKEYGLEGKSIIEENNTRYEVDMDIQTLLSLDNNGKPRYEKYVDFVFVPEEERHVERYLTDEELQAYLNPMTEEQLEKEMEKEGYLNPEPGTETTISVTEYINHSGGANGSDTAWDEIGQEFGVTNHRHYYTGEKTPRGNTEISSKDFEEGRYESAKAAKRNYGYQYNTMKDERLIRNWAQVKYSDAIFAIGEIAQTEEELFPNIPRDVRTALEPSVTGGTGYAVGMAKNHNKPIYVFDQSVGKWYTWNYSTNNFEETGTPILTKNFAGIGTREINEAGKQAIRDVYEKTFDKNKIKSDLFEEDKPITKIIKPKYKIPMNFTDGTGGRSMRSEFKDKSTMDLILSGDRIATTRDLSKEYNNIDISSGDIIQFYDNKGRVVNVEVTSGFKKIEDILDDSNLDIYYSIFSEAEQKIIENFDTDEKTILKYIARKWSKLEGWSEKEFYRLYEDNKKGSDYQQFQFKLISESKTEAVQQDLFSKISNITDEEAENRKKECN